MKTTFRQIHGITLSAAAMFILSGCVPSADGENGAVTTSLYLEAEAPTPTPTTTVDTTAPVIAINGANPMTLTVGTEYSEPGATAADDTDGNISANIQITGTVDTTIIGTYTITYTVSDAAGNVATATRTVNVVESSPIDTTAPFIALKYDNPMVVIAGYTYTEPGAIAWDGVDGDISANIQISGNVDSSTLGTYTITYTISDAAGNTATATRTVNVVNTAPVFNKISTESYFQEHIISTNAVGAKDVYAIDIDGDGDNDVLSASTSDNKVAWYQNDGSGNFTEHSISTNALYAYDVYAMDIDGDGDNDVVSGSYGDNKVAWYANDGAGNFTEYLVASETDDPDAVFAIDLDGDGDSDILSATWDSAVIWYENNGSQSFSRHVISTNIQWGESVFAIDLDGDGDNDVLSASINDDKIAWYENDGSESFTEHNISTTADGASSVFAIDLDGDSDIDVLSASKNDKKIAWYENDGSANFTEHSISINADGGSDGGIEVYALDLDNDGDLDVLSASYDDDKIAWYENDGSENFTEHIISLKANGAYSVYALDVDGDGDNDVLSASSLDNKIAWYEQLLKAIVVDEGQSVVGTIAASDSDGHTLSYSISGGVDAALFAIDPSTGELSFVAAPDYGAPADSDGNNVYEVSISVTDGYTSTSTDIKIGIRDLP